MVEWRKSKNRTEDAVTRALAQSQILCINNRADKKSAAANAGPMRGHGARNCLGAMPLAFQGHANGEWH
jgi:hypothetical protein